MQSMDCKNILIVTVQKKTTILQSELYDSMNRWIKTMQKFFTDKDARENLQVIKADCSDHLTLDR